MSLVPQKIVPVQALSCFHESWTTRVLLVLCLRHITNYGGSEVKARDGNRKIITSRRFANIMRTIALGDIPTRYFLGNSLQGVGIPNCNFRTGTDRWSIYMVAMAASIFRVNQFSVIIGVAQNTGSSTVMVWWITLYPSSALQQEHYGVATLSSHSQRTEAYFVIRNIQPNEQANDSMRPKLAGKIMLIPLKREMASISAKHKNGFMGWRIYFAVLFCSWLYPELVSKSSATRKSDCQRPYRWWYQWS